MDQIRHCLPAVRGGFLRGHIRSPARSGLGRFALSLAGLVWAAACWSAQAQSASASCLPTGGFTAQDAKAKTSRDIQLVSGETLVLAGIDIPSSVEARAAIVQGEMMKGGTLRYISRSAKPDRYNRIPADVVILGKEKDGPWLQGELVRQGLALASLAGAPCDADLLALERQARLEKAGLWSQAGAVQLRADDAEGLKSASGQFHIFEGKVTYVGVRDYATFLNFGYKDQHRLTVMVLKKHLETINAAHPLADLKGKRIRVRGVLEAGASPRLSLQNPLQLEVLE